jgi:UDP-N-acetylglucosamine 2-epimerase (non-hydrolysing)
MLEDSMLKTAIIVGTRPEIIKMSPIIWEYEKQCSNYFILHTGQHYSFKMDKVFFDELQLPKPKYNLDIGSGTNVEQVGRIMVSIERILIKESLDLVLVQGDTNTTQAAALAAVKSKIKTAHIEAGLRSFDRSMPEEINRIVVDHIADYLFAPTYMSKVNLLREGLDNKCIFVTGNTIVDAIHHNLEIAKTNDRIFSDLGIKQNGYFLVTVHRPENVDKKERLKKILKSIELIYQDFSLPIVFPVHPRTMLRMKELRLQIDKGIILVDPITFFEFLQLEANARMVLTDSGGIQEETCILRVPCVTLRNNTERPETLKVGSNILAGIEPFRVRQAVRKMSAKKRNWENPFGRSVAKKIVKILL